MQQTTAIYILCGGKSSRMGMDKALVQLNGLTLVEHLLRILLPMQLPVSLLSDKKEHDIFGLPRIADKMPGKGPLGGIYSGLLHSQHAFNLFISCDTPFISADLIRFIFKQETKDHDVIAPRHKGQTEPLCALYSKSCADPFAELLTENELSLIKALKKIKTNYLDIENEPFYKETLFMNINTPEELKTATSKTA